MCFVCMLICASRMPGDHGGQRDIVFPGARVTDGFESLCGCLEPNPSHLQEQQVLFITEPSLQALYPLFRDRVFHRPSWYLINYEAMDDLEFRFFFCRSFLRAGITGVP